MDQIDALAWRFRERTVPRERRPRERRLRERRLRERRLRERRLREIAFYAEHQSYETEDCPVWED